MRQIIELQNRKNQLEFEIESMRVYIETMNFDNNLKSVWFEDLQELENIKRQLDDIYRHKLLYELMQKKDEISAQVENYERQIEQWKDQLTDIDRKISEYSQTND